MGTLEQFAVILYDRSSTTCKVDEARLDLFARKQRAYNAILPTKVALKTHQTSNFQIGHTWGQATVTIQQLLPPSNWGWQKQKHMLIPNWTEVSAMAECCQELQKCGAKLQMLPLRSFMHSTFFLQLSRKLLNAAYAFFFASVRSVYSEIPLLRPPGIKAFYLLKTLFAKFQLFFSLFSTPSVPLRDHLWDCPKMVFKTTFGQSQRWS